MKDEITKAKEDAQWQDAAEKATDMGVTSDEAEKAVEIMRSISPEDAARLNDDIIAKRLAEAMGWEPIDAANYWRKITPPAGHNTPIQIGILDWSPASRWDHCGIVIDWMESQGKMLINVIKKDYVDGHYRLIFFNNWPERGVIIKDYFSEPMTPRHICLAALEAL